jgi:hypothetical protein
MGQARGLKAVSMLPVGVIDNHYLVQLREQSPAGYCRPSLEYAAVDVPRRQYCVLDQQSLSILSPLQEPGKGFRRLSTHETRVAGAGSGREHSCLIYERYRHFAIGSGWLVSASLSRSDLDLLDHH